MDQIMKGAEEEAVRINGGKEILKYLGGMIRFAVDGAYAQGKLDQSKEIAGLKETITSQSTTLDSQATTIDSQATTINSLSAQVTSLTTIIEDKDKIINDLQEATDASGQYNRRDNFKIMGIPQQEHEDLIVIAKSVTKHIGREISEHEISDIHRLPSPNNSTNSTNNVPGIILRVNRRTVKHTIMDNKKILRTSPHAEYPNLAIYEDLTPLRSRILYALRNRTKDGNKVFKFTWSKQGRIYCRTEEQSKPGPDRKLPRPSVVNKPNDLLKLGFSEQEVKEIIQTKRK